MRVLIADRFPEEHVARLTANGFPCTVDPSLDAASLPDAVKGHDVLVVRSTKVPAAVFDAADSLALVIRAGAGVNTIDWMAAAARGVYVCNTPGKNAIAVAELAIGLLLALDRRIPDAVADLREGRWRKKDYQAAAGLAGRVLGIIGLGGIGMAVAQRARGLEMEVIGLERPNRSGDVQRRIADLGIRLVPDRSSLLAQADAVTIHVPATKATAGMVSDEFLSHLKRGAFLINTSRGDIVDERALLAAIEAKGLRVGLDVYDSEPAEGRADFASALAAHPNVYGTHHIGASTAQAQYAVADEVVALIEDFASGTVRNCVNRAEPAEGTTAVEVRHHNQVGALASVLEVLRRAGLNVEQMHNEIFAGGHAAAATIHLAGTLDHATLEAVSQLGDVLGVSVVDR